MSATGFHKDLTDNDIHQIYDQVYASLAERDADTDWNEDDLNVGKVVFITGTSALYMLLTSTPTWLEFGGGGGGGNTFYQVDGSLASARTVTSDGFDLTYNIYDTDSGSFTKEASFSFDAALAQITAFAIDVSGGTSALLQVDPTDILLNANAVTVDSQETSLTAITEIAIITPVVDWESGGTDTQRLFNWLDSTGLLDLFRISVHEASDVVDIETVEITQLNITSAGATNITSSNGDLTLQVNGSNDLLVSATGGVLLSTVDGTIIDGNLEVESQITIRPTNAGVNGVLNYVDELDIFLGSLFYDQVTDTLNLYAQNVGLNITAEDSGIYMSTVTASGGDIIIDSDDLMNLIAVTGINLDSPLVTISDDLLFGDFFASFFAVYSFTPPSSGNIFENYLGSYTGSANHVIEVYIRQTGAGEGGQSYFKVSRTTGGPEPIYEIWDSAPTDIRLYWSNDGGGAWSLYFADLATASGTVTYHCAVVTQEGLSDDVNPNSDDSNIFAIRDDNAIKRVFGDVNAPPIVYGSNILDSDFAQRHQFVGGVVDRDSQIIPVYQESDFGTAVGGVITLTPGVYQPMTSFAMSNRLETDGTGSVYIKGQAFGSTVITYLGTDTLFTAVDTAVGYTVTFDRISMVTFAANGTVFNIGAGVRVACNEWAMRALAAGCTIGTFENCDTVVLQRFSVGGFTTGVDFHNVGDVSIAGSETLTALGTGYIAYSFTGDTAVTYLSRIFGNLTADQSLMFLEPTIVGPFNISDCDSGDGDFFDPNGLTGDITDFADGSPPNTTLLSVTDNGGIARFNYTPVTTYYVGQTVTLTSGGGTYPDGDYVISATDGSNYIEFENVDFIGTDTGTISANVVVCLAVNLLLENTPTQINESIDYNGGYVIFNVTGTTFSISAVFNGIPQTGIYSSASLDQTDPRVFAINNGTLEDSKTICNVVNNGNTTVTPTSGVPQNTWINVNISTPPLAQAALGITNELFILVDFLTGEIEYQGLNDVLLDVNGTLVCSAAGGGTDFFEFRLLQNGNPLPSKEAIAQGANLGNAASLTVPVQYSVRAAPEDRFLLQVRNTTSGTRDVLIETYKFIMK